MLTKLLTASALAFLWMSAATNAQRTRDAAEATGALRVAETLVADYAFVFDHPEAVQSKRRPVSAAVAIVADFLVERADVPMATRLPQIEFVSSAHITARRYRGLISEPELLSFDTRENAFDMFYDDAQKTILLSEHWTGGSPAELSVLVHAMVNHAQSESGLTYSCIQTREEVAFAAQDAWLRQFGQDVKTVLGLDEAAYLLSTQCIP